LTPPLEGAAPSRLDELDQQILSGLQLDGRRAFSHLAVELGVSEGTIRQRYQRLVNAGILHVVGVVDPSRIGFNTMALIGISVDNTRNTHDIAAEIASFPEVIYAAMSTGSFDLLIEVIAENNEEFARFLTEKLHLISGIARLETFMLLRVYKAKLGTSGVTEPLPREPLSAGESARK